MWGGDRIGVGEARRRAGRVGFWRGWGSGGKNRVGFRRGEEFRREGGAVG